MSVLVIVESGDNKVKKTSREAVSFASAMGGDVTALALGSGHDESELKSLGNNGAANIVWDDSQVFDAGDTSQISDSIYEYVNQNSITSVILPGSINASAIGGRLSVKMDAALVTNVTEVPGGNVKRSIFTGKAFESVEITSDRSILIIKKNASEVKEEGSEANVERISIASGEVNIESKGVETAGGGVLLPDAEIVVSGGRGLKGPENWGMVEELASLLGAGTACSKPVSDMEWRPHHEHVGQTGIKVSPQLYIAIGISGAIQHLAGVNSSKYIVVINKDPEAPFFKEADYGIVGDAFQVVPELINAIKAAG